MSQSKKLNLAGTPLSLNDNKVRNFWRNRGETVYSQMYAMAEKETWVVSHRPSALEKIEQLCAVLSSREFDESEFTKQQQIKDLTDILTYISTPLVFRLMSWLDIHLNGLMCALVVYCASVEEEEGANGRLSPKEVMRERLIALNNMNFIDHVFEPSVTEKLKTVLSNFEQRSAE